MRQRYQWCCIRRLWTCLSLFILVLFNTANAAAPPEQASQSHLATALATDRFVSYVPRSFSMHLGTPQPATAAGIRADLQCLRPYFSGLITYGMGNGQDSIPELAVAAGFRTIILGIWDPTDRHELDAAIAVARRYPRHIAGLVLGNEGLFWKRYTAADVTAAATYVRKRLPHLALGSSEPFSVYLDSPNATVLLDLDVLLPNVHPRFEPWFDPTNVEQSVNFVSEVLQRLHERTSKPILIKETGLPSAPAEQGFSEERQAEFWTRLLQRIPSGPTQNIAGFEAFDAPWKPRELQDEFGRLEPSEAHWGLFRQDGGAKPVIDRLGRWPAPRVSMPATPPDSR